MRKFFLSSLMLTLFFVAGCSLPFFSGVNVTGEKPPAIEALTALKEKDFATLATLVNDQRGLRLSPYTFINTEKDISLDSTEVAKLATDPTEREWGNYDGSGEEIRMTGANYFEKFVYDKDFLTAPETSVDKRLGNGNSIDNSADAYPAAQIWEYHFSGFDPKYEGMDWESLRLVFEKFENRWWLVGIIHDAWTI
jgi:hypothetical protein